MQKEDIKEGILVRLKSGGPTMVVQHIDPEWDIIECVWDDGKGRRLANYSSAALVEAADMVSAISPTHAPATLVGISSSSPKITLPIPVEITDSLKKFKAVHQDERKSAFIMMKYGKTHAHSTIAPAIKSALERHLVAGMRVDDRSFHTDLHWNIRTYMHGCSFGIAVFERIVSDDFNPNVAFEAGYMMALGKPVLLLKDKTLEKLHADLDGKIYEEFDTRSQKRTITAVVEKWLEHNGFT